MTSKNSTWFVLPEVLQPLLVKQEPTLEEIFGLDALISPIVCIDSTPVLLAPLTRVESPQIVKVGRQVSLVQHAIFTFVMLCPVSSNCRQILGTIVFILVEAIDAGFMCFLSAY